MSEHQYSLVNCYLQTKSGNGFLCSYYIPLSSSFLTNFPEEIMEHFPYEGKFHFRLKIGGNKLGLRGDSNSYYWFDLSGAGKSNNTRLDGLVDDVKSIDIRVISLDYPSIESMEQISAEQYGAYLREISSEDLFLHRGRDSTKETNTRSAGVSSSVSSAAGGYGSGGGGGGGGSQSNSMHNSLHGEYVREPPYSDHGNMQQLPSAHQSRSSSQQQREYPTSSSSSSTNNRENNTNTNTSTGGGGGGGPAVAAAINIQNMKKGATSLWKAMKAGAEKLQSTVQQSIGSSGNPAMSPLVQENLGKLTELVMTDFDYHNPFHIHLLEELWACQMIPLVHEEFNSPANVQDPHDGSYSSNHWKQAGWQNPNIVKDLKISGLLALQSSIYFGQNYPESEQCLLQNRSNIKTNYPFAIVAVNLTLLLSEIFALRDFK